MGIKEGNRTLESIGKLREYARKCAFLPPQETATVQGIADEIEREVNELYMLIKPRTIEDVLCDLLEEWATRPTAEDVLVEKYADELRSMGSEER